MFSFVSSKSLKIIALLLQLPHIFMYFFIIVITHSMYFSINPLSFLTFSKSIILFVILQPRFNVDISSYYI